MKSRNIILCFLILSCSWMLSLPHHLEAADNASKIDGMVFVKGGCFQMGDIFGDGYPGERPVHEVCVNDFYIAEHEVTQREWEAVMGSNPSISNMGDEYPVDSVSWEEVQVFIEGLNKKTGKKYRLPTEAEWEYAARSRGKKEKFSGTSDESEVVDYAWYDDNAEGLTHPVKEKKPNSLGLYDMSGNVWEWAHDYYDGSYYDVSPKDNPMGPDKAGTTYHILRGGSWYSEVKNVRTFERYWSAVDVMGKDTLFGFRLALSPE